MFKKTKMMIVAAVLGVTSMAVHAVWGGQCVQYVKNYKPGGYVWDKYYPKQNLQGLPVVSVCDSAAISAGKCVSWVGAKDIWSVLATASKGSVPKVGSVLVLNSFPVSAVGHVAVVTAVNGSVLTVTHSNWESTETVSGGKFTLDGKGGAAYTTSAGVKWATVYPVLGFVYQP